MPAKNTTKTQKGSSSTSHKEKITAPALRRILFRASVRRISGDVYEKLRNVISDYSNVIVSKMVVFVDYNKRKTAQVHDLTSALRTLNIDMVAGLNPNSKKTKTFQSCNSKGKSGLVKKSKNTNDSSENANKKPHRYRPGVRAKRAIKFQQKHSKFLAIPKANFKDLIRHNIVPGCIDQMDVEDDFSLRFSEGVIELLQLVVENYLVRLCRESYKCTKFAKRETIQKQDIELAIGIHNANF